MKIEVPHDLFCTVSYACVYVCVCDSYDVIVI